MSDHRDCIRSSIRVVEQHMVAPIKAANRSKPSAVAKPAPAAKAAAAAPSGKKPELQLKKRPASSVIADDGDFPRGGASALTPLERREVERQAKDEFDAEILAGKAPRTTKKQKQDKVGRREGTRKCGAMPCHVAHSIHTRRSWLSERRVRAGCFCRPSLSLSAQCLAPWR